MEDNKIKELLKEYEQKRKKAEQDLVKRKETLYETYPDLKDIEDNLNKFAIETSKSILLHKSEEQLSSLKNKINALQKQRSSLLKKYGKDESFLKPFYECSLCQDTGYITNHYQTEMCSCLKQKLFDITYNKFNIGNLEKENFDHFNIQLYSNVVDENKYKSPISPRDNIQIIFNIVQKFLNNFDSPEEKNLLFTGNTGLGKTFLTNCISKTLMEKGKTVLYQTAPIMLDNVIDYRFGKKDNSDIYENILTADLLVIDDLGTESMNNIKFTELFNIINSRLLNQEKKITKTIISTNLSLQNLFSIYDERIVSRIVGYYNICKFFGDDIRFQLK